MESKFKGINEINIFNHYECVHIFLYSYNSEGELYLLMRLNEELNQYEEINGKIIEMETSPTITALRLMSSNYFGLFTDHNMIKVANCISLEKEDLDLNLENENNLFLENPWFTLKEKKSFLHWVRKFEDNPIQYDQILGEQIYFFEMPLIDIEFFNKNLKQLEYPHQFIYVKYNEIKNEDQLNINININPQSFNLMISFNFDDHIKNTKEMKEKGEMDNFIMISLAPPCKKEIDDAGAFLLFNLYSGLFRRNNEKWIYFKASENRFPEDDLLSSIKCKAVIIPGSSSNVYNKEPHTMKTIEWIKNSFLNEKYSHIKFLGICYGHQIFSQANEGNVQRRRSAVKYIEDIQLKDSFWELEFVKKSGIDKVKSCSVMQFHQDDVVLIPPNFQNIGHSISCENEIFIANNEKFLTFQGHPEYTPEFFFFRTYNRHRDEDPNIRLNEFVQNAKKFSQLDYKFRYICFSFLKN